ncbi:Vms1/Ankzf1 family peptidyl-tRNA hydrolase [Amycolatopsis sp. NBC_01488]|uniref:Rv2629 family ribosome hibernation factor n=1 Tax=Amycolatopsis sp. NBC_01488 TaxID=2903563 RepID=UPI002E28F1EF|nr:Vms1/Ankzf1 family peptidyl-tRNA hydrolase [Amycolatopsis sp. NBC_01488]
MDTATLRDLTADDGPFASVHFDFSHDTEDAAKQLELRLKEIEASLSDQRADPATIEAVLRAVRASEPPVGKAGRSIIAAHGSVLLDRRLAAPPPSQVVRFSALPYLLPLATHAEENPKYVLVVVDRVGAEITEYADGGPRTETVEGENHPVHKVRGGGTAHHNLQNSAEETARRNLVDVADHVAKAVERSGAHLVVLAGEKQARTALHETLPEAVRRIATEVDAGSRADGSSREGLDRQVHELLTGRRLAALDDLAERFRAGSGREGGLAVTGLEAVTSALAEANVETLLVGSPGDTTVFGGPDPAQVAVGKAGLQALGVAEPEQRRADEAIPFAAVATGAQVAVLDERVDLWEGFGAILRHS